MFFSMFFQSNELMRGFNLNIRFLPVPQEAQDDFKDISKSLTCKITWGSLPGDAGVGQECLPSRSSSTGGQLGCVIAMSSRG